MKYFEIGDKVYVDGELVEIVSVGATLPDFLVQNSAGRQWWVPATKIQEQNGWTGFTRKH